MTPRRSRQRPVLCTTSLFLSTLLVGGASFAAPPATQPTTMSSNQKAQPAGGGPVKRIRKADGRLLYVWRKPMDLTAQIQRPGVRFIWTAQKRRYKKESQSPSLLKRIDNDARRLK